MIFFQRRLILPLTITHLGYLKYLLHATGHVEPIWDNSEVFSKISLMSSMCFLSVCPKLLPTGGKVYVTQHSMNNAAGSNCRLIYYNLNSSYTHSRVNYRRVLANYLTQSIWKNVDLNHFIQQIEKIY